MRLLTLPANPQPAGQIAIPRKIVVDCSANTLIAGPLAVHIDLPRAGSLQSAIDQLMDEIDHQQSTWGPPGLTFRWEPQLVCRVHADGLETFYRLRFALAGSSIKIDHVLVSSVDSDVGQTMFLRDANNTNPKRERGP